MKSERPFLDELITAAGLTSSDVAHALKVSEATVNAWRQGRNMAYVNTVISLAELLGVPLDVLVGRVPEKEAALLEDFRAYFQQRRETAFLDYINQPDAFKSRFPGNAIAPWPYNLLEDVLERRITSPLTRDQEIGVQKALEKLGTREASVLEMFYREGLSQDEIGRQIGRDGEEDSSVTKARVSQILSKTIRKLRSPPMAHILEHGYNESVQESQLRDQTKDIDAAQKRYDELSKELQLKKDRLNAVLDSCTNDVIEKLREVMSAAFTDMIETVANPPVEDKSKEESIRAMPLQKLNISSRITNQLKRVNILTVGDALDYKKPFGSIMMIGQTSFEQLEKAVFEFTGRHLIF